MLTFWVGWIVGVWMLGRGDVLPAALIGGALIAQAGMIVWGALYGA